MDKTEMARKSHGMAAINGVSYSCSHFFAWGIKYRADADTLMEMALTSHGIGALTSHGIG